MDYKLKRSAKTMILRSSYLMNGGFIIPLAFTILYTIETPAISIWHMILLLVFAAGASYKEKWIFDEEMTSYTMQLFLIPVLKKSFPTREISFIALHTFLRGEKKSTQPGGSRKWYQTEQGLLKLEKTAEKQETLIMDTNRRNLKLQGMGEELAAFLEIPFKLNP